MDRPADMNQLAKRVVDLATGAASDDVPEPTGRAKSAHGATSMTAERRSEIPGRARPLDGGAGTKWLTFPRSL